MKRLTLSVFVLFLFAGLCSQANAQETTVTVYANGYGQTEGEALASLFDDVVLWLDTFDAMPGMEVVDIEFGDIDRVLCQAPEPWHLRQSITVTFAPVGPGPNPNGT